MKRIVALMISGLLASTAALAQDSKTAPATPAAASPSGAAPAADQSAKKKQQQHHKSKKTTTKTAKTDAKADAKPADTKSAAAMAPAPDAKK